MKKRYLTIEEAARRFGVDPGIIRSMIDSQEIESIEVNGRMAVSELDAALLAAKEHIRRDGDEAVSISEAARRVGLPSIYVSRWVSYGWVPVLGYGSRRAKLISLRRVEALARLQRDQGLRGRRLIPRGQEATVLS